MANEERRNDEELDTEHLYKTKTIQFKDRKLPIILQNDNGPCPLIAICNVLLLRNSLNLNLDASEVSLQRLLSLVAEKLIDCNNNTENKDAGYLENQQQNIGDAIDLLPRLATGIDVNVQFRKIDDFEFTRECAIFDLLNIPLCHGWIVDPQDFDTSNAIGAKSYNTLMGELVALETKNAEEMHNSNLEEDCIDFSAATTATLGVPSPCLSRGRSFDDSPHFSDSPPESGHQKERKGDIEEAAELLKALQLSKSESPVCSDEGTNLTSSETAAVQDLIEVHPEGHHQIYQPEESIIMDTNATNSCNSEVQSLGSSSLENCDSCSKVTSGSYLDPSSSSDPTEHFTSSALKERLRTPAVIHNETDGLSNPTKKFCSTYKSDDDGPSGDQHIEQTCPHASTSSADYEQEDNKSGSGKIPCVYFSVTNIDPELSASMRENIDVPKSDTISLDGSEPLYEGEDRILDSGVTSYENREPMYEGEVVLADQAERGACCDVTQYNGKLIRTFLRSNASQLTVFGLFCLLEEIKDKDPCVFFRNNHFSTMYKYKGQLYLLATDQGFINQPDLVWEKLNEVNGDTVFMTGDFKEFKVNDHNNNTWDRQNVMASTVDYLASFDNSTPTSSTFDSDMQLAIELQEQELNSQPQRSHTSQQSSSGGNSRLITGPQVQRSNPSHSSSKQDAKSKDKCSLM